MFRTTGTGMAHFEKDRIKLLNRVRRIRGQVGAIETALKGELDECSNILQTMAACRGALNALMAEVIEGHIRNHVVNPDRNPRSEQSRATQDVIDVINAYLK